MAHGTGIYIIDLNIDIDVDDIVIKFFRDKNYYYEQYSDCYEPTSEWTDVYTVGVYRPEKRGTHIYYDDIVKKEITKDIANMIWYNLTHRQMRADDVINAINKL